MTRKADVFAHVCRYALVGVVREESVDDAFNVARAFVENGIRTLEITLTTPEPFFLIAKMVELYAPLGTVIAAGTVRASNDAAEARRAGAEILVSPHTDFRVIDYALEHELLCVAGAATPTEIIRAWEAGASIIKIYPAPQLGGPEYLRVVQQPIRDVPMLAGGPVSIEAIDAYLDAGAVAVNLGASLAVPSLVAAKNWDEIGKRVARAVQTVENRTADTSTPAVVH
ncbi:MAG TPA: 2-dehydro-3-deoxyphosphogluconate aldolase [Thermoanaerobaculia bacterium]|nr:2-dehydro-3-deoxyphosphogluconate aldolase [Thermoanaerobaculia bacterium]